MGQIQHRWMLVNIEALKELFKLVKRERDKHKLVLNTGTC